MVHDTVLVKKYTAIESIKARALITLHLCPISVLNMGHFLYIKHLYIHQSREIKSTLF